MSQRLETAQFYGVDPNTGKPLVGGKLFTYEPGTTTPRDAYVDEAETVVQTNPVILDAKGSAIVFLDGEYDLALYDKNDVLIQTFSGVTGNVSQDAVAAQIAAAIDAAQLTFGALTVSGNVTLTVADAGSLIEIDASGGPANITLPNAAGMVATPGISFARSDNTANVVTILAASGETVNGAASFVLAPSGATFIRSDGTNWWRMSPATTALSALLLLDTTQAAMRARLGILAAALRAMSDNPDFVNQDADALADRGDIAAYIDLRALAGDGPVDETSSRTLNVAYQNTEGRDILVTINGSSNDGNAASFTITRSNDNFVSNTVLLFGTICEDSQRDFSHTFVWPAGEWVRFNRTAGFAVVTRWEEYK